ncbi:MAG: NAD(P)/FAD-dependent oxidoreductase, partial [Flavisolibacter sp.]|nr:NAD(P)/FAD-dependent oxidoreductase [Flavisolibacter sp.]
MQHKQISYDVAVIGGGLAGLSLSIQLSRLGHQVLLLEKEKYPFHKVCGEYISMESWPFLENLGLPLRQLGVPRINHLHLTAPNGKLFATSLPLGGFGISRFTLDNLLFEIAKKEGVTILEETKVQNVEVGEGSITLQATAKSLGAIAVTAKTVSGSYGKRSNLDIKWKRSFIEEQRPKLNNYIAVKYHVHTGWPVHIIGLHNFEGGYCGISKVDGNAYCLCYLTTAACLQAHDHSIAAMEKEVLYQNPELKSIFQNSTIISGFPLTISQISFSKKTQTEKGILLLGDAAGMVTPLCGNGMSMALHSSKLAAPLVHSFLQQKITQEQMEQQYRQQWQHHFA